VDGESFCNGIRLNASEDLVVESDASDRHFCQCRFDPDLFIVVDRTTVFCGRFDDGEKIPVRFDL